jgi:predicted dehydrogenase
LKRKKLRIGVIGLGKMGLLHTSLLNTFANVQIVALCDKSRLITKIYRSIFSSTGVILVNNMDRFSELELDAVYIATPISSHYVIVKKLFEKGIVNNIFTEKTLASNYNLGKEMCEDAKKIGGITMVGYMKRFSVVFEKAKNLLVQGKLGAPYYFKAYAYSSDFLGLTKDSNSSVSRGGALSDIGCHIIDLILWLLGDIEVNDVSSSYENGDYETYASFTAENSIGLKGRFDISQRMPNYRMPEFGCYIECPQGKIDVNDDRLYLKLIDGTKRVWYKHDLKDNVPFWLGETEYYRENENFVNSLLNKRKCEPNFDNGLKVDYIIDQVRKKVTKSG